MGCPGRQAAVGWCSCPESYGMRGTPGLNDSGLWSQGEKRAVRYLFRKGLEVNNRSRYVHLSWGIFERDNGQVENARELFRRGHALNPQDAAILQVRPAISCEIREGVCFA